MRLVFGDDARVAAWVVRRIPYVPAFGPCVAIGIADGNRPVAGVVYSMWNEQFGTMQISCAADDPRWAQRGVIRACLHYPFEQQGVRKLWSIIASGNERSLRFNKGLGFKQEAILSHQYGKEHGIVTRMFDRDYRRLYSHVDEASRSAA